MRNKIAIAIFFISLNPMYAKGSQMEMSSLQTSLSCKENPHCIFDKKEIIVSMTIKNTSQHEVGLTIDYIYAKGLHCYLMDVRSLKKITLRISLTPDELKNKFTVLRPGEAVDTERVIDAGLITSIRTEMIELKAVVGVSGWMQAPRGAEPEWFVDEKEVTIIGRDKFELNNNF